MADTNTATPPAANGGAIDPAVLQAAVGKVLKDVLPGLLDTAIKPITERLGETEKNLKTVADTVAGQKVLGEDQVKSLINADAQGRAEQAKKEAQSQQTAAAIKAKRDAFAAQNLKNVPVRYHAELGDDEAKWADAAKTVRNAFSEDMKAAGIKVPSVGGDAGGEGVEGSPAKVGFLKMPGSTPGAAT